MASWHREHLMKTILAMVIDEGDQHRFVTIHEPEGQNKIPCNQTVKDIEAGKKLADTSVQNAYPHKCDDDLCSDWQRFAAV